MTRKPKLVALTGCAEGAGTSTIASSLAAAFAESGEGKVLFVNMNHNLDELHPLFEGKTACSLSDALEPDRLETTENGNLFLATTRGADAGSQQIIPKRFYDLVPHLKASDYEYIVFDMPPLGPTSSTLTMATFMDKVILVVEAEVSNKDCVKHVYAELVSTRADVSAVFNKNRSYGPKSLQTDL